jgi:hypothetical protein
MQALKEVEDRSALIYALAQQRRFGDWRMAPVGFLALRCESTGQRSWQRISTSAKGLTKS